MTPYPTPQVLTPSCFIILHAEKQLFENLERGPPSVHYLDRPVSCYKKYIGNICTTCFSVLECVYTTWVGGVWGGAKGEEYIHSPACIEHV